MTQPPLNFMYMFCFVFWILLSSASGVCIIVTVRHLQEYAECTIRNTLKRNNCSSISSYQLLVAPQREVSLEILIYARNLLIWFAPVTMGTVNSWVQELQMSCSKDSISHIPCHPQALKFFPQLLWCSLSLAGGKLHFNVSCRTESSVSHSISALPPVTDLCINCCPLQKETSVTKVGSSPGKWL